jgi:hypothetical protein
MVYLIRVIENQYSYRTYIAGYFVNKIQAIDYAVFKNKEAEQFDELFVYSVEDCQKLEL